MYYFAAGQDISTGKLASFFPKFKKTPSLLRVKETNVTSRNTFIDNHFALKSQKE